MRDRSSERLNLQLRFDRRLTAAVDPGSLPKAIASGIAAALPLGTSTSDAVLVRESAQPEQHEPNLLHCIFTFSMLYITFLLFKFAFYN